MLTTSTRRRASRAVAVLASGLLAVGLAQAPSSAVDRASGERDRLSVAELRDLAALADRDAGAEGRAGRPRRVDVVADPRGDAERFEASSARGPKPYTRLADLTSVRYKTPSTEGGDLRITTRWAELVDGSRRGVRRQLQVSFFSPPRSQDVYVVEVSTASDRVRVFALTEDDSVRVRPDKTKVRRTFGPGGTTDVVLSGEWLDARRLTGNTIAIAGSGEGAYDGTNATKPLVVGPVAR